MASILPIIAGIFKFWDEIIWLIKTLQGTPEAHRQEITARIMKEAEEFEKTGRPTW